MTTTVTLEQLEELGACTEHRARFAQLFPEGGVEVTVELCVRHASEFDWEWAANNLLTYGAKGSYWKGAYEACNAYNRTVGPSRMAYDRVREPALDVFNAATAPAREAYQAGGSYPTYLDAIAPAEAALEAAVKDTREAHYAACRTASEVYAQERARAFGEAFLSEANQAVANV